MMFFSTSLNRLASTLIISRATLGWVSIRDSNCQDGRTRHVVSVFAITSAERGYLSSKVISPKNCPLTLSDFYLPIRDKIESNAHLPFLCNYLSFLEFLSCEGRLQLLQLLVL